MTTTQRPPQGSARPEGNIRHPNLPLGFGLAGRGWREGGHAGSSCRRRCACDRECDLRRFRVIVSTAGAGGSPTLTRGIRWAPDWIERALVKEFRNSARQSDANTMARITLFFVWRNENP